MNLLSPEEQHRVCGVVQRGCDYETAVKLIGRTLGDLRTTLRTRGDFACELARSEAICEFRHMENLQKAAEEPKNWRVSVWWLEHRLPERFASRRPGTLSATGLQGLLRDLAAGLAEDVRSGEDRRRIQQRLEGLARQWGEQTQWEPATEEEKQLADRD